MTHNPNTITECQYIGDTSTTGYVRLQPTCCRPTVAGRAYCEEHLWRVYQKGTAVHRRKDKKRANAVWDLESELNAALEELEEEGEV